LLSTIVPDTRIVHTVSYLSFLFFYLFFFNAPSPTELYTLSLHDALPISFVDLIAASVEEIEVNGELLEDPAGRFDGARVRLPALREGENTVRILAEGTYMNTGEGLHRFVDRVDEA